MSTGGLGKLVGSGFRYHFPKADGKINKNVSTKLLEKVQKIDNQIKIHIKNSNVIKNNKETLDDSKNKMVGIAKDKVHEDLTDRTYKKINEIDMSPTMNKIKEAKEIVFDQTKKAIGLTFGIHTWIGLEKKQQKG